MSNIIGNWGTINIQDSELKSLSLKYNLRYAFLKAIYGDPIIQFVGKDVISLEFTVFVRDYLKIYDFWVDRKNLTTNLKNLTIGDTNFGNFYHTDTDIIWNANHYLEELAGGGVLSNSIINDAGITIRGIQELNI